MAIYALVMISLFQLDYLALCFEFMTRRTLFNFLAFLPHIFSVLVFMVAIGALESFVLHVWKNHWALLGFFENVS